MPGSARTGGSRAPAATCIRSGTDPSRHWGRAAASLPGAPRTRAERPREAKKEERRGRGQMWVRGGPLPGAVQLRRSSDPCLCPSPLTLQPGACHSPVGGGGHVWLEPPAPGHPLRQQPLHTQNTNTRIPNCMTVQVV